MIKKYTDQELKLLNSNRGIKYVLTNDPLDFDQALSYLRFRKELSKLQADLIKVQNWVVENGKRLLIIFEGREFAGKGRSIDAFTDHLNPRTISRVALNKPTDRERAQWYFKRYVERLPEKGEIVFFDRSWYNRAVIEPVNGFCSNKEYQQFMKEVNLFEKMLVSDGILLIKFYLEISKEEQIKRIDEVKNNPLERWQLGDIDLQAVELFDKYSKYIDKMLDKTSGKKNPWKIIHADDINRAVLEEMKFLLDYIKL